MQPISNTLPLPSPSFSSPYSRTTHFQRCSTIVLSGTSKLLLAGASEGILGMTHNWPTPLPLDLGVSTVHTSSFRLRQIPPSFHRSQRLLPLLLDRHRERIPWRHGAERVACVRPDDLEAVHIAGIDPAEPEKSAKEQIQSEKAKKRKSEKAKKRKRDKAKGRPSGILTLPWRLP